MQREAESAYAEVRDPESCVFVSKGRSFLCNVCRGKVSYDLCVRLKFLVCDEKRSRCLFYVKKAEGSCAKKGG